MAVTEIEDVTDVMDAFAAVRSSLEEAMNTVAEAIVRLDEIVDALDKIAPDEPELPTPDTTDEDIQAYEDWEAAVAKDELTQEPLGFLRFGVDELGHMRRRPLPMPTTLYEIVRLEVERHGDSNIELATYPYWTYYVAAIVMTSIGMVALSIERTETNGELVNLVGDYWSVDCPDPLLS